MSLEDACERGDLDAVIQQIIGGANVNANRSQALIQACTAGHADVVDVLRAAGADLAGQGQRALRMAGANGHLRVVGQLIDAGVSPRGEQSQALWYASQTGRTAVVRLLLSAGAEADAASSAALRYASSSGHADVVELLLSAGADVHANNDDALRSASANGHLDVVECLLAAGASHPQALAAACKNEHVQIAEWLLAVAVEEPRTFGRVVGAALAAACEGGHEIIVDMLCRRVDRNDIDSLGAALEKASAVGILAIVQLVFAYSAAELATSAPWLGRALVSASRAGHSALVDYLLAVGAGEHAAQDAKNEALRCAAAELNENGAVPIVVALLAAGADVHMTNDLPLSLAARRGDARLVRVLLDAGANATADELLARNTGRNFQVLEMVLQAGARSDRVYWGEIPADAWTPGLVLYVPHQSLGHMPAPVRAMWLRYRVRYRVRLRARLERARAALDHPPRTPLGVATPTRDELIVHLRSGGRMFAREYWKDGIKLFFPALVDQLGELPDEFAELRL